MAFTKGSKSFSFLDNNQYQIAPNRYELLVGLGVQKQIPISQVADFKGQWIFGHLNYEFRFNQELDPPTSGFPLSNSYLPETVLYIPSGVSTLHIASIYPTERILEELLNIDIQASDVTVNQQRQAQWQHSTTQERYLKRVEQIRDDIFQGKYYEINYCTRSMLQPISINPIELFKEQQLINPAPFSALYRMGQHYLICGSPERFLIKEGRKITAQPIKGTIHKSSEPGEDAKLKQALLQNPKERAENVMIVDLTRNDLSKVCRLGSIAVPELFGIYTFPFVHQMISTITGELKEAKDFYSIFKGTYPMGSMTGAPKQSVMEHIERYEDAPRGIYSGSLFYINPEGDFDSNVVIRSIIYDELMQQLSYNAGGAITYDSNPKQEWEEVLLKSRSMKDSIR